MQKLIFSLILCLLTINLPTFAQTTKSGNPNQEQRETGKRPGNARQVSNRSTSTKVGKAKRHSAGANARKAIPRTTRQEQPAQTRQTQRPPVTSWPELPSRRGEDRDDNRWSSRDENGSWRDRRDRHKGDNRRAHDDCRRDRRDRDWDRDDRHECHCKGHGNGKGKGHYKKKGNGHGKRHGCD